jgi:hypothetical protein
VREFVVYTIARFALFFICWGVVVGGYALINGGGPIPLVWPLLVAAVVSVVISAYLLRGMRERLAQRVQERAHRMASRTATDDPGEA